jgi:solute carrier family 50 protein (sugar transporter)
MDAVGVVGLAASSFGVVMASAPLLQARTILRRRSAADVSQGFLAIIAFGALLWAVYGFADHNWFIFVPNVVGVVTNLLTLLLARRYAQPLGLRTDAHLARPDERERQRARRPG